MDGKDALRFWRAHKDVLLALAASDGRGVASRPTSTTAPFGASSATAAVLFKAEGE